MIDFTELLGRSSFSSSVGRFSSSIGRFSSGVGGFGSGFSGRFGSGFSIGFGVSGHRVSGFASFFSSLFTASSEAQSRSSHGGSKNDLTHRFNSLISECFCATRQPVSRTKPTREPTSRG